MTEPLRTLVTNDDGIGSPGLSHLAAAARAEGLDVVVAAPARESSGSSASIKGGVEAEGRIKVERRPLKNIDGAEPLDDVPAYAVSGAPALIALIAAHGAFGAPPALVLSGVNRGANLGQAILHSGTVGAALTAGVNGSRGLAVSLDVGLAPTDPQWETAAELACQVLPYLVRQPGGTVWNLNVPDVDRGSVAGLRTAPLAPFGIVQTTVTEKDRDHVRLTVADNDTSPPEGTDAAVVAEGYAAITAVRPVCSADAKAVAALREAVLSASPAQAR